MSESRVFTKTQAGIDEMHLRLSGLNARVRQLLILVDGKRTLGELRRMMMTPELDEFVALLELKSLILAKDAAPLHVFEGEPRAMLSRVQTATNVGFDATRTWTAPVTERAVAGEAAGMSGNVALLDAPMASRQNRFDEHRRNLMDLLAETVGPMSEDLCHRIGRATKQTELMELFVAALTVVGKVKACRLGGLVAEPIQFDQRVVYIKTSAGSKEVLARKLSLNPAERRILIIIDGKRSVAELPDFARPGEIVSILAGLSQKGLIQVSGMYELPSAEELGKRRALDTQKLDRIKAELESVFERELGVGGQVWDARLADSVSLEVVRTVLREAIDVLFSRAGEPAARRVIALVRPILYPVPSI
jgi:hypothetical protein